MGSLVARGFRRLSTFPQATPCLTSTQSSLSRLSLSQPTHWQYPTPLKVISHSGHIAPFSSLPNLASSRPLTESPLAQESEAERERKNAERRKNEEAYLISFTCKPCGDRTTHRMSKQGYHRGTVLIQCPSCKSRHVMSDHLGIFFDKSTTLEDLLEKSGQSLTHGQTDGDVEFWEDGTLKKLDARGVIALGYSTKESP